MEPPFTQHTVQESVVSHLRALILNGKLAPGQRLVQDELSEQLGVSRTPIREALHRLAHEGFVTFSKYKGAAVAQFSTGELVEVYTVRVALESQAAYLAARQISAAELLRLETLMDEMGGAFQQNDFERLLSAHRSFHVEIYAVARRERLYELILRYLDLTDVYQRMALSLGRGATDPIVEHIDILNTLRSHDPEAASQLIRIHLEDTLSELLKLFSVSE
jgi:DNA-binding GntR family transcriptional regulator